MINLIKNEENEEQWNEMEFFFHLVELVINDFSFNLTSSLHLILLVFLLYTAN